MGYKYRSVIPPLWPPPWNCCLPTTDMRERLGRQAHADVVANYTWDVVSEPVREVYLRLAKRHGES